MAEQFKIEKGGPVPERRGSGHVRYPWLTMEVGDSFFVAGKPAEMMSNQAAHVGRIHQRKFTCRKENGGVRVWRVE